MAQMTLVLGGARSGKSAYAQQLALARGGDRVLYVATAEPLDEEMEERIAAHRTERPAAWHTLEAPRGVGFAIRRWLDAAKVPPAVVLVDCLTLLISNVLLKQDSSDPATSEAAALDEIEQLLATARETDASWIVVSNEVGMGLVPPYPLGRAYRDALGRVNQRVAAAADEVLLMIAGIPWQLKPAPSPGSPPPSATPASQ
ncbi:MAG: bifunctional adenosylcobinamide kinase/adenosylcobinamide-phosphate guanylyltransferase [Chloroflexi bacterium]|nr:bifunctional adenosylcobinamide kinase/adenosylcobinamide-phosphate guanylyltransferase [Chloroflexota bacterium]